MFHLGRAKFVIEFVSFADTCDVTKQPRSMYTYQAAIGGLQKRGFLIFGIKDNVQLSTRKYLSQTSLPKNNSFHVKKRYTPQIAGVHSLTIWDVLQRLALALQVRKEDHIIRPVQPVFSSPSSLQQDSTEIENKLGGLEIKDLSGRAGTIGAFQRNRAAAYAFKMLPGHGRKRWQLASKCESER